MNTIYKYKIGPCEGIYPIMIPKHAIAVHVGIQNDTIHVWMETDPEVDKIYMSCKFTVVGTGYEVPDNRFNNYIGTVHKLEHIWHVYKENLVVNQ